MKRIADDDDDSKGICQKEIKRLRKEGLLTASFDSDEEKKEKEEPDREEKEEEDIVILNTEPSLPRNQFNLSPSQQEALDIIMRGNNVFITGEAGSGKSFLIQHIVRKFRRMRRVHALTATTGVAAWHINGVTLHRFAGVGMGNYDGAVLYNMIRTNAEKLERWRKVQTIIIDEISLCDTEFFEKLESLARKIRGNNAVFGGIQIILVGDYFQCPPIMKGKAMNAIKYLFESPLWQKLQIRMISLKTNFRQSNDTQFHNLLEHIKLGQLTEEDHLLLKTRLINKRKEEEEKKAGGGGDGGYHGHDGSENRIKLCSLREDAKHINLRELALLPGEGQHYKGKHTLYNDSGIAITEKMIKLMNKKQLDDYERRMAQRDQPTDEEISLKIGAKVILCCNLNVKRGLYNGSRGIVIGFQREEEEENKGEYEEKEEKEEKECKVSHNDEEEKKEEEEEENHERVLWPLVKFDNNQTVLIMPHKWERRYYDRVESSFIQLPLLLCYAITIHKSQGLTLSPIEFDMKFFAPGLGYVAFSRAPSLNNIFLNNIDIKSIRTDPAVIQFYKSKGLL
jgi:ATP-dependent DNA helicase PIF1